jgi:hypothetical protein
MPVLLLWMEEKATTLLFLMADIENDKGTGVLFGQTSFRPM